MVDDDENPSTAPAGNEPAGKETETPPPAEPEGDKPEGEPAETKEASDEIGDDVVEDDKPDEDDDEDEGEGEGDSDADKAKHAEKSRLQRYREKAERLARENEALRTRSSEGAPPSDQAQLQRALEYRVWQEIGDPPKPEDYKDDYVALSIARQAYENDRRTVTREVRREFTHAIRQEQERVATLVAEHKERVARFKTKVKDFDEVMARATLPVAPHVERLLINSKKSERLGYVLGKNQAKLAQLNAMDPESAAREIGRLEGRLSLPPATKTQTQARKPIVPLKGGGSAPPTGMAAVAAWTKKQYGDRA